MENKFSKKKLKKMIKSNFTDLSSNDIKELIDAEISKGAENIDTDYIDLCFELLAIKNKNVKTEVSYKTKTTRKSAKSLLVAAVVAIFMISAITASAYVFDFNIPEVIAKLFNNNAIVDMNLENADTTADGYVLLDYDFAKSLAQNGINPITIPEDLLNGNSQINKIEYPNTDKQISTTVFVDFEYDGIKGELRISQAKQEISWSGYETKHNIISGQMIKVNGMDILIFERAESCTIRYKDGLTDYNINLEGNIDKAINFAKTIK